MRSNKLVTAGFFSSSWYIFLSCCKVLWCNNRFLVKQNFKKNILTFSNFTSLKCPPCLCLSSAYWTFCLFVFILLARFHFPSMQAVEFKARLSWHLFCCGTTLADESIQREVNICWRCTMTVPPRVTRFSPASAAEASKSFVIHSCCDINSLVLPSVTHQ